MHKLKIAEGSNHKLRSLNNFNGQHQSDRCHRTEVRDTGSTPMSHRCPLIIFFPLNKCNHQATCPNIGLTGVRSAYKLKNSTHSNHKVKVQLQQSTPIQQLSQGQTSGTRVRHICLTGVHYKDAPVLTQVAHVSGVHKLKSSKHSNHKLRNSNNFNGLHRSERYHRDRGPGHAYGTYVSLVSTFVFKHQLKKCKNQASCFQE